MDHVRERLGSRLGFIMLSAGCAIGRAAQASPVKMYQQLEKPGQKWLIHGGVALFGNICILGLYVYGLATFQWR